MGDAAVTAVYLINRCPSSATGFKTPIELWRGKPADYTHLRVFGALAFAHIRQDKLAARAIKCAFIGYPAVIKGYKLWRMEPGEPKCIISRDVVFDETRMAMLSKDQKLDSTSTQVEVELPLNETLQQRNQTEDLTDEQQPEPVVNDYNLVRDRARRNIIPPRRYGQADLIYYALNIGEGDQGSDPSNYTEAVQDRNNAEWIKAMNEEMKSIDQNQTWTLVDPLKGQRVVGCKWIFKRNNLHAST